MSSPISIGRKNDEETGGKIGHAPEPEPEPEDEDDRVRESSHDWQYDDAVSSSGLTGGFTTITNVFEANGVGSGEQIYSPSRSIFEVVDIIDGYSMARTASIPRSNEGSKNDSFDSYYHMQKNGPPLIRRGGHNMRYGWRRGGLSEANASSLADTTARDKSIEIGEHHPDDESDFDTNGASSLSSLTNDWVPKIARKGKGEHNIFTTPKRNRKQLGEDPGSTSPTSSNDKSNSQNSKIFPRKKRNNLVHDSPWYVNKHHSQSPSAKNSSQDKTPMASPPDEVLIAQCHRNKVSGVSEPSPSVISSSNLSQYFTNELREIYNSNVYRSYRHRYNQALSSPKAKRIILSSAVIAAIFAIVAIIAISLGTRQNDRSIGEVSTYDGFVPNNPLPEKCCVGNYNVPDDGGIVDVEEEYEMIEPSAAIHSISKPPSPSVTPVQNPVNKVDWDYVSGSNPTPGEDLIEWRPSVLPSWQPPPEEQVLISPKPTKFPTKKPTRNSTKRPTEQPTFLDTEEPTESPTSSKPTKNPTKQPTSKYQTLKPSSTPSVPDYVLPTVIPKVLVSIIL